MVRYFIKKVNAKGVYFPYFLLPERMASGIATARLRALVIKKKTQRFPPPEDSSPSAVAEGEEEGISDGISVETAVGNSVDTAVGSSPCTGGQIIDMQKHNVNIKQMKYFFFISKPPKK